MKRRVFVAIGVSYQLQEQITAWQEKLNHLPVRWIKPENLHVTLIPPWYTTEVDEVISSLESINKIIEPFTITFREVTFGPNPIRPRLIWVSADTPSEIIVLKSKLEEVLPRQTWLAQKSEKREFLTHLTIARFKEKYFFKFPIKDIHDKVFWEERVSSFLLMESHLAKMGAEYERLAEILLKS